MNPIRILFCGANGRMGRAIAELIRENEKYTIAAGIDLTGEGSKVVNAPVYKHIAEVTEEADVIVDFSHRIALPELLDHAKAKKMPIVVCTTGHTPEDMELMQEASATVPVFFSRNMSVGINLLISLCRKASAMLGDDFDIEIVEAHHHNKLDAPSGTALMIADAIAEEVPYDPVYTYDRHAVRQKRAKEEIGIHAIRGGSIVGEHSVIFAGPEEVVTLSHSAGSRSVFASGALRAAAYIIGKPAGMYNMNDVVAEIEE
ncbi:MAG: 4-hydroxy-tetrahydrodipicolinate reductase [Clostridia bacterium]|nr:4-hydroxy-tetrahydrodipicolinate reductase [Clostridia bacterium]